MAPKKSTHESSYLSRLKFDPKLEHTFIARYLTNFRYVFLLILIIAVVGTTSYLNLPRRLNPQIKIPIVLIATALPGAGPQDVESLVTVPVEDAIEGLPNINTITSVSQENVSIVSVEFRSGVDPDKAKDDIQSQVDSINNFPEDTQDSNVQKLDFENQPVWQFLITTSGNQASLMQFSQELKDKVKGISTIKDVRLTGQELEEIQILIKSDIEKSYGISANALSRAIQAAIPSHPAGSVNTETSSFTLTLDPTINSTEELRNQQIIVNGQPLKLSQIADIVQRSSPNQAQTLFTNKEKSAERAVAFSVFKTDSADIDRAVEDTKHTVEQELKARNERFQLISILDTSELITKQFNDVLGNFRDTIILVIITLFIFMGIRQALIVAFSIPLSFLVTFTLMQILGLTINFLTLFSLILALGLLVDDAIVMVTAMTAYWRSRKFTSTQTGLLVLRDFFVPIWSTTITAVWAFLPLLLSTGIIGEFIKSIPIVVSTTLLASTAIAILITLPLTMVFLKPSFPKRVRYFFYIVALILVLSPIYFLTGPSPILPIAIIAALTTLAIFIRVRKELFSSTSTAAIAIRFKQYSEHGIIDSQKFAHNYQRTITKIISSKSARRKTLVMVIIFAIASYALVPLGFVTNEFFPKTDQDVLFLSLELPPGTNLARTQKEATTVLEDLRNTKELKYITAQIGQSLNMESGNQDASGSNKVLYTINLTDMKKRKITSFEIADELRNKFKSYTTGRATVLEQSGGPPAGADIQIKLLGDDSKVLDTYAEKIMDFLKNEPGVASVEKSINPGTSKIVFVPNRTRLASNQVTENDVANVLRIFASGSIVKADVKFNSIEMDITTRQSSNVQSPQALSTLTVQTPSGQTIPLIELGEFRLAQNPTQITREAGRRTISVSAGIKVGFNIQQVNQKLEAYVKNDLKLPEGYETKTGGVNEENQKSVNSILQSMVLAFLLIAATMVLQFGSYRKALIILLLIPLAISGVFIVFALSGTPLSFPTLIGILALFGIVVYQAMMIVDKINRNLRTTNMSLKEAVTDGAASRVEPILFGTITTCMGLVPITLSDPLWRGLGGAIISGMLFSGAIMLLFIPVVYYMIYQNSEGRR